MSRVIIVGSGPAGLTAAIYAARASLKPLVFEGQMPGGQLTTTTVIENWPGYETGIEGPLLMDIMKKQAIHFGAEIIQETLVDLQKNESGGPLLKTESGRTYEPNAVILATGASPKFLPHIDLKPYVGRGVSTCATCDGFFYRGRTVAVVGGGDSAAEESLYLANLAQKVYLIHRRDRLRASVIMAERVLKNPKIQVIWNTEIADVVADAQGLTALRLKEKDSDVLRDLAVDGLFLAVGHSPNTRYLDHNTWIQKDEHGYIKTFQGTFTSQYGVFAAGDIEDPLYRQAITAAGRGCQAALQTERFLAGLLTFPF